jgi:hypothetical protein
MKAIPQYNKGYFDIRAKVDEGLVNHPGIFLGGNYICGVAFGSCVEWGVDTAPKVRYTRTLPVRYAPRPLRAPSPWLRVVASEFCPACLQRRVCRGCRAVCRAACGVWRVACGMRGTYLAH